MNNIFHKKIDVDFIQKINIKFCAKKVIYKHMCKKYRKTICRKNIQYSFNTFA